MWSAGVVGLALYVAASGCRSPFDSVVADVGATIEHCGAGSVSPTVVRLENPNDQPVTTGVEIGVYDDSTGEEVLRSGLLKSVPAGGTVQAEKDIFLGPRAFLRCEVLDVTTRQKLPGVD